MYKTYLKALQINLMEFNHSDISCAINPSLSLSLSLWTDSTCRCLEMIYCPNFVWIKKIKLKKKWNTEENKIENKIIYSIPGWNELFYTIFQEIKFHKFDKNENYSFHSDKTIKHNIFYFIKNKLFYFHLYSFL